MRLFIPHFALLFFLSMKLTGQGIAILEEYQWKNRVVLVFTQAQDQLYQQQLNVFNEKHSGMLDRDLLVFTILPKSVIAPNEKELGAEVADKLQQKYHTQPNEFAVVLIGKDGGQKLKKNSLLSTEKLFGIIDQMPMRRREMREKPG